MNFSEWFQRERGGRAGKARFCREAVIVHATLMKALRGVPVERKAAQRISDATGGAVSAESIAFPAAAKSEPKKKRSRAA